MWRRRTPVEATTIRGFSLGILLLRSGWGKSRLLDVWPPDSPCQNTERLDWIAPGALLDWSRCAQIDPPSRAVKRWSSPKSVEENDARGIRVRKLPGWEQRSFGWGAVGSSEQHQQYPSPSTMTSTIVSSPLAAHRNPIGAQQQQQQQQQQLLLRGGGCVGSGLMMHEGPLTRIPAEAIVASPSSPVLSCRCTAL